LAKKKKAKTGRRPVRRSIGRKEKSDYPLQIAKLEGKVMAKDILIADLRGELAGPKDLAALLDRIDLFAQRAENLSPESLFAPGLELIIRVAQDLRMSLPPFESSDSPKRVARHGDVRDRHGAALEKVLPWNLVLAADRALEEAARVGNVAMVGRQMREMGCGEEEAQAAMERLARDMPLTKADPIALKCVRERLGARLPRDCTDSDILGAVKVYRLPPKLRPGRPRKGEHLATENERAGALAKLLRLDRDAADIASDLRQQRATRVRRLQHLGVLTPAPKGSAGQRGE
jgi:hypothetical protein